MFISCLLGAEDRGRGWGCDASIQKWEFLSSSGEASKSRGRVFRAFSHWAVIPPGQPSLFLLSGSGGAAGSKAKRPCTSATKSRGSLPTPAPHFLAQSCSAFPGCRGEQARVGRLHTPFRKARAAEGTMTAARITAGGRSPEEQARAEVRFLQRVGLHLRVQRQHHAGCCGRGEAQRCSDLGEAPAAPGGDHVDAEDQSAFGICWAGPENHRLLGVEHPQPARSPPPATTQPPVGVACRSPALPCCHGSGRSRAVCGVAGPRGSQAKASRSFMQVGGKATGSSMEKGRRTRQHEQTSSKNSTWLQTPLKLLY